MLAISFGLSISFRLLVLGKDRVEPDWLNLPIIFAALVSGAYGSYLLIEIFDECF